MNDSEQTKNWIPGGYNTLGKYFLMIHYKRVGLLAGYEAEMQLYHLHAWDNTQDKTFPT